MVGTQVVLVGVQVVWVGVQVVWVVMQEMMEKRQGDGKGGAVVAHMMVEGYEGHGTLFPAGCLEACHACHACFGHNEVVMQEAMEKWQGGGLSRAVVAHMLVERYEGHGTLSQPGCLEACHACSGHDEVVSLSMKSKGVDVSAWLQCHELGQSSRSRSRSQEDIVVRRGDGIVVRRGDETHDEGQSVRD